MPFLCLSSANIYGLLLHAVASIGKESAVTATNKQYFQIKLLNNRRFRF